MVQLKPGHQRTRHAAAAPLPCLKGHGPIEALLPSGLFVFQIRLPCLKGHGPIEAHAELIHDENVVPYHV